MWGEIENYIEERPALGLFILIVMVLLVVAGMHLAFAIAPETYATYF